MGLNGHVTSLGHFVFGHQKLCISEVWSGVFKPISSRGKKSEPTTKFNGIPTKAKE